MKLFEAITIRGMELKNRIVMAPMGNNFRHRNERVRAYFVERAKGGVGAIILGGVAVDALHWDEFVEGIRTWITQSVHEHGDGVKIGVQLWHGNQYRPGGRKVQWEWVAPSPGPPVGTRPLLPNWQEATECYCREITISEINDVIGKYATSAVNARKAGFDFVELHACHGHNLCHQFFSPLDNRRKDIYGGDLAGRMRFNLEVAVATREVVGNDYPFFWRLSPEFWEDKGLPGGATLADNIALAVALEKVGVDVIDVSFGHEASQEFPPYKCSLPTSDDPMGTYVELAAAIKKKVSVPIIGVGRIHSPEIAEKILQQGKVDLVALGRQLLADPYWPQKVKEGRQDDIVPCMSCNNCIEAFMAAKPIDCAVNASLGREGNYKIRPAKKKREVLVIGGGPAGMEAARVAALRGHHVVLCEKADKLGGQLLLAAIPTHKKIMLNLINYFTLQLQKEGVEIKLRQEANFGSIKKFGAEVVVLATGATQIIPNIHGVDGSNVVTATEVLDGRKEVGGKVVIIGGELVACDVAEFLVEKGKKVIMTEIRPKMAASLSSLQREGVLYRLGAKGVIMFTGVKCDKITDTGLVIYNQTGKKQTIEADTIVIAAGSLPNNELTEELKEKVNEVYQIGDCVEPRKIIDAIYDGARVGREI